MENGNENENENGNGNGAEHGHEQEHDSSKDGSGDGTEASPDSDADEPLPPPPPYGLSWTQAELVLTAYKADFLPVFPFVVPPSGPARLLWRTRPLLFRAVVLVAAP